MLGEHHQLHTAGARFLALYGEHLAFLLPGEAAQRDLVLFPRLEQETHACWEQWLVNRAEAMDRKRDVSRKLRLAVAYDTACFDDVNVAWLLPADSPIWQRHAWIQAAESHAARAHHQATAAAEDALQMSAAVFLESWYATAILGCT
uniref:Uncharacterized protein n=1 Tax=Triticum urartu TaxID=4572 RepID=A0A8R7VAM9_TRIUA